MPLSTKAGIVTPATPAIFFESLARRSDSARALTGACYGLITTVDGAGRPRRLVGSGFTEAHYQQLKGWADEPRLFEHLMRLPGPLRFEDVPRHLRCHSFQAGVVPYGTALGAPIDCGGGRVGYLFVADKEGGGEFTRGDDEVLPLFASRARTPIPVRPSSRARSYPRLP